MAETWAVNLDGLVKGIADLMCDTYARGVSDSAKVADEYPISGDDAPFDIRPVIATNIRRLVPNQEGESG